MQRTGLRKNAAYLVRPDGYIGTIDAAADPPAFEHYLDEHGIRLH